MFFKDFECKVDCGDLGKVNNKTHCACSKSPCQVGLSFIFLAKEYGIQAYGNTLMT